MSTSLKITYVLVGRKHVKQSIIIAARFKDFYRFSEFSLVLRFRNMFAFEKQPKRSKQIIKTYSSSSALRPKTDDFDIVLALLYCS